MYAPAPIRASSPKHQSRSLVLAPSVPLSSITRKPISTAAPIAVQMKARSLMLEVVRHGPALDADHRHKSKTSPRGRKDDPETRESRNRGARSEKERGVGGVLAEQEI